MPKRTCRGVATIGYARSMLVVERPQKDAALVSDILLVWMSITTRYRHHRRVLMMNHLN